MRGDGADRPICLGWQLNLEPRPSALDRALSVVTRVGPGEGFVAVLLAVDVCLLLTAYYVIKPVREALILAGSGAEVKSYASLGQALVLAGLVPLYARLADRLTRRVLISAVTLFFMACLGLFYLAVELHLPGVGILFYLWVGVFNLMVVAQFWSFAADLYSRDQGERLFPIVAFGASIGAVFGSQVTTWLVAPLGISRLLLVSALALGVSLVITRFIDSRPPPRPSAASTAPFVTPAETPRAKRRGAFRLVLSSPYLLLLAVLVLLVNVVNTTGEFVLGSAVERAAEAAVRAGQTKLDVAAYIGEFYGRFYFWVNVAGVVLQLLFVSRIIRLFGVSNALLVLPAVALLGYGLIFLWPILSTVRWAKTAENATDYSLQSTVRNALFLPLSREEKYQAKQVIDSFFVRGGDVLSAGVVFVGLRILELDVRGFALLNMLLVGAWLLVAVGIGQMYRRKAADVA